uniref:Predicted protein n=1 Tax=Hordeum vulgare subsp. vulgare TaxID=112509 RepID=F2CQB2_HORVV|nr:predicted protein [Hordeum vulgare subsp. vulgare]BAJ90184.1 predicted protein [Hordeum vulgare subsp. vulgare]
MDLLLRHRRHHRRRRLPHQPRRRERRRIQARRRLLPHGVQQLLDGLLGVRRREPGAAAARDGDHGIGVAGGRRVGDPGGEGLPQRRGRPQHLLAQDPRCQGHRQHSRRVIVAARRQGRADGAHGRVHSRHLRPGRVAQVRPHLALATLLQERPRPPRPRHHRRRRRCQRRVPRTSRRRPLRPRVPLLVVAERADLAFLLHDGGGGGGAAAVRGAVRDGAVRDVRQGRAHHVRREHPLRGPHDVPPQGHPHRRPHRRHRRRPRRLLQLPHDSGPPRLQRHQRARPRAQAAAGGGRLRPDVVLCVRPAVVRAVPAVPRGAQCHLRLPQQVPAVPLPAGPLQRPGQPHAQHQRRRHPQPLRHRHQRRLPPGLHARLLPRLLRARRAQLRRGGAVGALRPHHPHRRHVRPPGGHAAGQTFQPRPRPGGHPRLGVLPRRHAPDDGVRVRHHRGAHQQPAPPAACHARPAHLQDRRRLLQRQHLRPHRAPQGPALPRRPRRALHAAAQRGRRGGRPAAELQRRGEGRPHHARAPDHGTPRVPGHRRAAVRDGARALRPGAQGAPPRAPQEAGVPPRAGAVPQGVQHRGEVRGAGLRQARLWQAGHGGRRGAVAGGDGDVHRPAPLHQRVAIHRGGDHVAGQGPRPLPRGRTAPPPRRAQGMRQVAGGRDPDEARLHAGAHPGAAPRAARRPVEAAPVAQGRRRQVLPRPHRAARQLRLKHKNKRKYYYPHSAGRMFGVRINFCAPVKK